MVEISNHEFRRLADYSKDNFGIHLNDEKKTLVSGRLGQVLQKLNMDSFSEYMNYVFADRSGEAANTFINKITTNHTFFMREADHFTYFRNHALPNLMPALGNRDLRVWSAGCSSGEEPYTLAMLMDEYLGPAKTGWDTKILATDISEQALIRASKGIYDNNEIALLPRKWRLSYFNRLDNSRYQVTDRIKSEVIYRRFNLMEPFPFKKKFHAIFCRNVMIYFDAATKQKLIQKFYDSLEPQGYLFIGHSETIDRNYSDFKYLMPAVYQKE